MKFAVIEAGGKQYKVASGDKIKVEKLSAEGGGNFIFDKVLLTADEKEIKIGTPYIEGAKVEAKTLRQERDKKKIVFRYHSKTRYRKKKGHRQWFTEVQILNIH
jgi:large subunit ribosomal protein L21